MITSRAFSAFVDHVTGIKLRIISIFIIIISKIRVIVIDKHSGLVKVESAVINGEVLAINVLGTVYCSVNH